MVDRASLETLIGQYLPDLERTMRRVVRAEEEHPDGLFGMLHYHLGWADPDFNPIQAQSGKRIRPILCLLSCEACGGDWHQALPVAAAIELLHNFTLIHDDIEDNDETRRGRPTVWSLWGQALAINAGDGMFALSQLALLRLTELSVPDSTVVSALELFNRTCVALTQGQHLDIAFEQCDVVSVDAYLTMIEGKTGALVACACEMGGLIAGASSQRRERLHAFGRHLGLSFQMKDDVLGVWGDPAVTGKPAGADIVRRKKSLPILHGLERNARLQAFLRRDEPLSAGDVRRARALLEGVGSRDYAERLAEMHHRRALAALEAADLDGEAAQALHDIAQWLLGRDR